MNGDAVAGQPDDAFDEGLLRSGPCCRVTRRGVPGSLLGVAADRWVGVRAGRRVNDDGAKAGMGCPDGLTRTRWPIPMVGSIDPLGIR